MSPSKVSEFQSQKGVSHYGARQLGKNVAILFRTHGLTQSQYSVKIQGPKQTNASDALRRARCPMGPAIRIGLPHHLSATLLLAMLWLAELQGATNAWGPAKCEAQMSISGSNALKTNQQLTLTFRLRNLSAKERFTVFQSLAPQVNSAGVVFSIISPSGKDVSPRPTISVGSAHFIRAEPNETIQFDFELTNVFKLTEIGTYKIVAKKAIISPLGSECELESNLLLVSVVGDQ